MKIAQSFSVLCLFAALGLAQAQAAPRLSPPPARGTTEDQADFTTLFALQGSRSDAECKRAQSEANITLGTFFGTPYGPLSASEVGLLSDAFDRFGTALDPIVTSEKEHWARLRPYAEDARIKPCVPKAGKFSYPSGHAAESEVYAELLVKIYPERDASLFIQRAHQIGDDRVLGGVHHPTDIIAGQKLAHDVVEQWMSDPTFVSELDHLSSVVHGAHH